MPPSILFFCILNPLDIFCTDLLAVTLSHAQNSISLFLLLGKPSSLSSVQFPLPSFMQCNASNTREHNNNSARYLIHFMHCLKRDGFVFYLQLFNPRFSPVVFIRSF